MSRASLAANTNPSLTSLCRICGPLETSDTILLGECLILHITGFRSTVSGCTLLVSARMWQPSGGGHIDGLVLKPSGTCWSHQMNAHELQRKGSCKHALRQIDVPSDKPLLRLRHNGSIGLMNVLASSLTLMVLKHIGCGGVALALHGLGERLGSMCHVVGVG